MPLRSIPDVIGLAGRRSDAAECRILQGRYIRSICILVPDPRGLDHNFHDVTIVDMGDVPESSVSIPELSLLCQQWPPAVVSHMVWLQQELEGMRAEARSLRQASSAELVGESPRRTTRAKRRTRPVRVVETSVHDLPVLTLQDPSDGQGAVASVAPCVIGSSGIGPLSGLSIVVSANMVVPPWEDGLTISGGGGSNKLVVPELGVAPLEDLGTDLEDELPTPDGSPSTDAAQPEVGPAPRSIDLELARALLEVGVLPSMVTPSLDPVVEPAVTPALYPVPPIPVLAVADPVPVLVASPLQPVGGSPDLDQSRSHLVLPPDSGSEPIPSRISPSFRTDDISGRPSGMAPMDQYLPRDASVLSGESTNFPFLPAPLTPSQITEQLVPGSVEGSPTGEPVAATSLSMPDLSRQGPFDVHQDSLRPLHGRWTVCGAVNTA